ncbi:MAG: hypothetical protein GY927_18705 [bacterium]|nr:hypothetical protein [bacterium]
MRFHAAILSAFVCLGAFTESAQDDHGKNFHCSSFPFLSKPAQMAMKQLAKGGHMRGIVSQYAYQWENEEIRRTCDSAAKGQVADFSCFDDRRDWDAIKSKIPVEFFKKPDSDLRPFMLELQSRNAQAGPRNDALNYCEDLGVIDRSVKG